MSLRAIGLGVLLSIAFQSQAQIFSGAIGSGINTLEQQELLPLPDKLVATRPSGNPLPPEQRAGDLPMQGQLGPEGGYFQLLSGDIEKNGPLIHVFGASGVEFTDRGYHCWADEAFGNTDTNIYTLKGHVRVEGKDESIYGDTVQVDFTQKTFVAENSEATLKPALTKGLSGNLYVKGERSSGSEKEVFGENTSTTTCSYPSPHFEIISESTDVRPNRRIIFRKMKLIILGHVVLRLPYLSVPLDQRNYNNLPVVGRDPTAGYFIKTRYSFPINSTSDFTSRFDYYSRLGIGLGGGDRYFTKSVRGDVSLFTIQGASPEYEFLVHHDQAFKWGRLTLDSSYEDNNYLISLGSKILNTRAMLYIPQGKSSDRISFSRTDYNQTGSNSLQQTITMDDSRVWNRLKTTFDIKLSDSTSSFTGSPAVHRDELDLNFKAVDDLQKAQAELDYIRSIPIGESSNFFTASDVTPSISLLSDSTKLIGQKFDQKFPPFKVQVGYGQYSVAGFGTSKMSPVSRVDFDLAFHNPNPSTPSPKTAPPGSATGLLPDAMPPQTSSARRWDLAYQGEFKQDVYSDNTAQYILQESTELTYNFHNSSRFNISYNYLRPYGYSPLQVDERGQENNFVADLSYAPIKNLMVGFATGYDFDLIKEHQPTPWQQVGLQATYSQAKTFMVRMFSTYDTTMHDYSSTRMDLTWVSKTAFLSLGVKYDGERNKWAAANLYLDGLQIGRLRTSVLLNYDGYTNQFDAMHYSFIYDLHCAEAVLQILDNPTGFNGGRSIYFFIRLKALPFDTPFGTGTRGQPIGTGTGAG